MVQARLILQTDIGSDFADRDAGETALSEAALSSVQDQIARRTSFRRAGDLRARLHSTLSSPPNVCLSTGVWHVRAQVGWEQCTGFRPQTVRQQTNDSPTNEDG